ncbi:MAG: HPF/RaiA family ribosome-associated protein [Candidatus Dependentiae bacterium]
MHKRITFRNMDHVAAIENYANDKLAKIEEFLTHEPTPIYIDLVLEPSKVHEHHRVELRIKSPHYDMISNYEGPEFYKVLDRVIDVMLEELHREKRKQLDERNHRIKVSKLREFQEKLPDEDDDDDEV